MYAFCNTYAEAYREAETAAAELGLDRGLDWERDMDEWLHAHAIRLLAPVYESNPDAQYTMFAGLRFRLCRI